MSNFKAYCEKCGAQVPGHYYGGAPARKYAEQNNISLSEALSLITT